QVVFDRYDQVSGRDLWMYDFERGTTTRLTTDPADDSDAYWAPDGQHVVFASNRNGVRGLYRKAVNGSAPEENLIKSDLSILYPRKWSFDGRLVFYEGRGKEGVLVFSVLPLEGNQKPYSFVSNEFTNQFARLSPNGRWLAYQSTESGKAE